MTWELPETSHSLLERVKDRGDGVAWSEFLAIYQPVVYRMARRRGMQDADAHDVSQQIFLAVSQAIESWEPDPDRPPFRAWLTTVARNAITKALSRARPDAGTGSSSVAELLSNQPADDPETTAELLRETRQEIMRWAAEQIRPEYSGSTWRLFWMTAVEGKSVAEVAESTGRTTGAIYMARHRVLKRLKEMVEEVSQHWEV